MSIGSSMLWSFAAVVPFVLLLIAWERITPGEHVPVRSRLPVDAAFAAVSMLGSFVASTALLRTFLSPVLQDLGPFAALAEAPFALRLVLGLLLGDLLYYWLHRALHLPALWRVHTVHHSIQNLYWLSSMRSSFLQAVGITVVFALGFNLTMLDLGEMQIALAIMGMSTLFSHANIRTRFGPLEWVLVTPAHHRMHHVEIPATRDRMFAGMFSFWDRLFGTYVEPSDELLTGTKGHELDPAHLVRELIGV